MENSYGANAMDLGIAGSGAEPEKKPAAFYVIDGTADPGRQAREIPGGKIGYRIVKRVFDIVASLVGMILLLPIFLLVALAIKIEDRGPVFFVQERNGINGKVFRMYKFRSMCTDAEKMHQSLLDQNELDGPAFKMKNDPRLTKVGKVLRRTSIDELPQLLNILKGEMSVVGPRPLPTYETEQCNAYQRQRMLVKPGLTCYWQCSGRNDIPFDEWVELDLKYIREAGILTDLRIILRTVGSVIGGRGAY
ncbi:MAG: sugar transferase [Lachnospiraceae bacterium]|nr:sugar transferase [Lachnospiraceae bacterium]MCM1238791.1 sugar transferase [Lachnospiraceae bacterium]MCM1303093.1 sugar transferase [Butyrivibrio sp.]MCM1343414.1 sugar transferase [Muribaculaceae bacterium]MCM1412542.1 sugar transferase [Lachnospiraceae bacterium]